MFNWIKDFITQRWIRTRWNNTHSKWKQTEAGHPQGAVTSPILLNLFINDLPITLDANNDTKIAMFTNDVVIYTTAVNKKLSKETLERKINYLIEPLTKWTNNNNMQINSDKTVYQIFSLKHKIEEPEILINDKPIKRSNNTTYLGITLDNKLTMKYEQI